MIGINVCFMNAAQMENTKPRVAVSLAQLNTINVKKEKTTEMC